MPSQPPKIKNLKLITEWLRYKTELPWLEAQMERINKGEHKCKIVENYRGFYALEYIDGYYNNSGEWRYLRIENGRAQTSATPFKGESL